MISLPVFLFLAFFSAGPGLFIIAAGLFGFVSEVFIDRHCPKAAAKRLLGCLGQAIAITVIFNVFMAALVGFVLLILVAFK